MASRKEKRHHIYESFLRLFTEKDSINVMTLPLPVRVNITFLLTVFKMEINFSLQLLKFLLHIILMRIIIPII